MCTKKLATLIIAKAHCHVVLSFVLFYDGRMKKLASKNSVELRVLGRQM